MSWLLAGIASIGAVEILLRLPLAAVTSGLQATLRRVLRVIRSPAISDHWKEVAVPAYASRLFRLTARLALQVVIVVSPFAVVLAVAALAGLPLLDFLSSMTGLLFSTAIAASYATLRIAGVRARL